MIEFLSQKKLMLSAPRAVKSTYICRLNMNADYRRADHITESRDGIEDMGNILLHSPSRHFSAVFNVVLK